MLVLRNIKLNYLSIYNDNLTQSNTEVLFFTSITSIMDDLLNLSSTVFYLGEKKKLVCVCSDKLLLSSFFHIVLTASDNDKTKTLTL